MHYKICQTSNLKRIQAILTYQHLLHTNLFAQRDKLNQAETRSLGDWIHPFVQ